jgi:5-methylcytosine-specific restriction endonuclease McrA
MRELNPHWRLDKRSSAERGYGSRWQKARASFLKSHPLCVMCGDEGRVAAANVVDHIKPHAGDQALFWAKTNWQPLCKSHHDSDKQMLEKSGESRAKFTADGRVVW